MGFKIEYYGPSGKTASDLIKCIVIEFLMCEIGDYSKVNLREILNNAK